MAFEELSAKAEMKLNILAHVMAIDLAEMGETTGQKLQRIAKEQQAKTDRDVQAAQKFARLLEDMTAVDNRTEALIGTLYPATTEDSKKPPTSPLKLCEAPANHLGYTVIRARVEQHPWESGPIQPNYNSIAYLLEGEDEPQGVFFASCTTPFRALVHNRNPGDAGKLLEFDRQLSALEALV